MIAARIGHDQFLVWRLPLAQARALLPSVAEPVISEGHAWLLFAIARLEHTRVLGWPVPGTRSVAGWLIPCHAPGGGIGNLFLNAFSDDRGVLLAYRALGLRQVLHARLRVTREQVVAPGVRAHLGDPSATPSLSWFATDRCGLIVRDVSGERVARLPLVKRGWHWQPRRMSVEAAFAAAHGATPVAAIDCSHDLAIWGRERF